MFNFTTVVFDGTSPTFISQTLRDGTPQVQTCTGLCRISRLKRPQWDHLSKKYRQVGFKYVPDLK